MPDATTTAPAPSITVPVRVDQPRDTLPLAANDPARAAAPISAPAGPTPVTTQPTISLPGGITAPAAPAPAATPAPATPAPAADAPADPNKPAPRKTLLADDVTTPPEAKKPEVTPAAAVDPNAPVYALKAPEKSLLTADDLKAIEAYGRENKLTPEVAQVLVNRESKVVETVRNAVQVEARKSLNDLQTRWEAECAADPALAGPKFAEAKALANRALNVMPGIKQMLLTSPYGSNPTVLKDLAALGKLLQEDTTVQGSSVAGTDLRSPAQRWFGK